MVPCPHGCGNSLRSGVIFAKHVNFDCKGAPPGSINGASLHAQLLAARAELTTTTFDNYVDAWEHLRSREGFAPIVSKILSRPCAVRMTSHSAAALQRASVSAFAEPSGAAWEAGGIEFTPRRARAATQRGAGMGHRLTTRTTACPAITWLERRGDEFLVHEWTAHSHSAAGDAGTYAAGALADALVKVAEASQLGGSSLTARHAHDRLFGVLPGRAGRVSLSAVAAAQRRQTAAAGPLIPLPPHLAPCMSSLLQVIKVAGTHGIIVMVKPVGVVWTATAIPNARATGAGKVATEQFLASPKCTLAPDTLAAVIFTEESLKQISEVNIVSFDSAFRLEAGSPNTNATCFVGYSLEDRSPKLLALLCATSQATAGTAWGAHMVMEQLRKRGLASNVHCVHSDVCPNSVRAVAWAFDTSESKFCAWHELPAMFLAMAGAFTSEEHLTAARLAQLKAGTATLSSLLKEEEEACHNALRALVLLTDKDMFAVALEGFVVLYKHVPRVVAVLCRSPYRDINATCMAVGMGADSVNEKSEKVWFIFRDLARQLSGASHRHSMAINFSGVVAALVGLFARLKHRESVNDHAARAALWNRAVGRRGAAAALAVAPEAASAGAAGAPPSAFTGARAGAAAAAPVISAPKRVRAKPVFAAVAPPQGAFLRLTQSAANAVGAQELHTIVRRARFELGPGHSRWDKFRAIMSGDGRVQVEPVLSKHRSVPPSALKRKEEAAPDATEYFDWGRVFELMQLAHARNDFVSGPGALDSLDVATVAVMSGDVVGGEEGGEVGGPPPIDPQPIEAVQAPIRGSAFLQLWHHQPPPFLQLPPPPAAPALSATALAGGSGVLMPLARSLVASGVKVAAAALTTGDTLSGDAAAVVFAAVARAPPNVIAAFPDGFAGWLLRPPAPRSGGPVSASHALYVARQRGFLALFAASAGAAAPFVSGGHALRAAKRAKRQLL